MTSLTCFTLNPSHIKLDCIANERLFLKRRIIEQRTAKWGGGGICEISASLLVMARHFRFECYMPIIAKSIAALISSLIDSIDPIGF